MVYRDAAKKTGGFLVLSAVMGMAIATFTSGGIESPTGLVVDDLSVASGGTIVLFALGFFVGVLALGTYFYVAHIETKRDQ